jgi:hypothetical protein
MRRLVTALSTGMMLPVDWHVVDTASSLGEGTVSRDGGHSERWEVVSEASSRRGCPSFSSQPRYLFVESFVPRLV